MHIVHDLQPDPDEVVSATDILPLSTIEPSLTPLERLIVEIGKSEAFHYRWSGRAPSHPIVRRFLRIADFVAGRRPVRPLADKQLERLRLLACLVQRDDPSFERCAERLIAGGLSIAAVNEAINRAGPPRPRRFGRRSRLAQNLNRHAAKITETEDPR
jgi:hypothetical protein